jgi:adenylyl-sulfate kinase
MPSATNITWQDGHVDREAREQLNGHRAAVLWFTGLSASGKTTLANAVDSRLHAEGVHACLLDGDNLRHGINANLGFSTDDRAENVRRIAECTRLFFDAGLIVLVAVISPTQAERDQARARLPAGRFVEIFVDTPIELCEERDPKGLYRRARAGEIPMFTGVSSPYERPPAAELHLDGAAPIADLAAQVVDHLRAQALIPQRAK